MVDKAGRRAFGGFVALALMLAATACTGDGDGGGDGARRSTSTSTTARYRVEFALTGFEDNGTKGPTDASIASVKSLLESYVDVAVVTPLRTGRPPGDLSPLFSPEAMLSLADPARRATLVEEGLPPASTSIETHAANAVLASVSGRDGVVAVIDARIDLRLRATGPAIDIEIVRQGDLVLAPGPEPDSWIIDSFALRTQRDTH